MIRTVRGGHNDPAFYSALNMLMSDENTEVVGQILQRCLRWKICDGNLSLAFGTESVATEFMVTLSKNRDMFPGCVVESFMRSINRTDDVDFKSLRWRLTMGYIYPAKQNVSSDWFMMPVGNVEMKACRIPTRYSSEALAENLKEQLEDILPDDSPGVGQDG